MLELAYEYAKKDQAMWVREPHLAGDTELSRYYDSRYACAESLKDETDHYRRVAAYFLNHPDQDRGYLVRKGTPGAEATVGKSYVVRFAMRRTPGRPGCDDAETVALSRGFLSRRSLHA